VVDWDKPTPNWDGVEYPGRGREGRRVNQRVTLLDRTFLIELFRTLRLKPPESVK
jgi:hypothetical protein